MINFFGPNTYIEGQSSLNHPPPLYIFHLHFNANVIHWQKFKFHYILCLDIYLISDTRTIHQHFH